MVKSDVTDYMLRVDGKPFRCICGCNVFRKPCPDNPNKYKCNACGEIYIGEDE